MFTAHRLGDHPIITPAHFLTREDGSNINGPSLIRKPDWIDAPGRYWLYFAHHQGESIRLAIADHLCGPYKLIEGGTLQRHQTHFNHHIASPDVHVDQVNKRIVMYYHGCCKADPKSRWDQISCVAFSNDGVNFSSKRETLSPSYLRMFTWRGRHFGIVMYGILFRSADGLTAFEEGPQILHENARHLATLVRGDVLHLFYSCFGDFPERIVHRQVDLTDDWKQWRVGERTDILAPEFDYEGVNTPHIATALGRVTEPSYQLRDPAIFEEDGKTYLLYSVAGEYGIALAELKSPAEPLNQPTHPRLSP